MPAVEEPLQDADVIAPVKQRPSDVGADEAGPPGDKDASESAVTPATRADARQRTTQQLTESGRPRPVHRAAQHEPLQPRHGVHADPRVF